MWLKEICREITRYSPDANSITWKFGINPKHLPGNTNWNCSDIPPVSVVAKRTWEDSTICHGCVTRGMISIMHSIWDILSPLRLMKKGENDSRIPSNVGWNIIMARIPSNVSGGFQLKNTTFLKIPPCEIFSSLKKGWYSHKWSAFLLINNMDLPCRSGHLLKISPLLGNVTDLKQGVFWTGIPLTS